MVVGPQYDEKRRIGFGGATVLMQNFRNYLSKNYENWIFVRTNPFIALPSPIRAILNTAFLSLNFISHLKKADIVMFNFSDHGVVNVFPWLGYMAKKAGKKVVLRKFGGSFDLYLEKCSSEKRARAIRTLKTCDLIMLETKASIRHMSALIGNETLIEWFPNVRSQSERKKNPTELNKRLGFLSHICDEKGVADILKMAKLLGDEYTIDLYGAIKEDKYKHFDWETHGVHYHGEVSSKQVQEILPTLLLLLLTSYREGYPGIIIEALAAGVPVLSTTAGGIPEMITDGKEGFLIRPGDVGSAVSKIKSLTAGKYTQMCLNAHETFIRNFEQSSTNNRILKALLS